MIQSYQLCSLYNKIHDTMRNLDGFQPQEAFDELLKLLFFIENNQSLTKQKTRKRQVQPSGGFSNQNIDTSEIRNLFASYVKKAPDWIIDMWRNSTIRLSDIALRKCLHLFSDINFLDSQYDIRSKALQEFITPEIRRGLGIFPTPDSVVKTMVDLIDPKPNDKVFDPACGTGTFLIEVLKKWSLDHKIANLPLYGCDISSRMLLLTTLNLFNGNAKLNFVHKDFFSEPDPHSKDCVLQKNYYDVILTNPPFGVTIDFKKGNLSLFDSCESSNGISKISQPSEILFIEQSLRYLKPGGALGIVVPKSVITNINLSYARSKIGQLGYIYAIVKLPPETFRMTGTQTTTMLLFFRKYREDEDIKQSVRIAFAEVSNVGYDSTGRHTDGNQLPEVAGDIVCSLKSGRDSGLSKVLQPIAKEKSMVDLNDLIQTNHRSGGKKKGAFICLGNLLREIRTGRTPPRASYVSDGLFLVKVGNLTGKGIDWMPRERNFVSIKHAHKLPLLQKNDILLTSSAHSPVYIAKKVDIVHDIPEFVGKQASFVGEVMLLRIKEEMINPYILLAYLRSNKAREDIQYMIRGQTAHLHPSDLSELNIPSKLLVANNFENIIQNLKQETEIAYSTSYIAYDQNILIEALFNEEIKFSKRESKLLKSRNVTGKILSN